ncbi:GDSL-type esterase/lipase family protein [Streptomyces sp. NBC_01465]|uniref:GDSL-type esterase/lipase family protein n=1 Tax=Streptomyces sp. NBC_01465 TaxID=2903878 RepID=UPI002E330D7E|nr:GDSL-type esterase/lipase family protein [Streptomyces sp. NBC_01465]
MAPVDYDSPEVVQVSLMIVGDSISHGSSGDWTWRYRFWKHLQQCGVAVDFVGPYKTLDNIRTEETGDGDNTYADTEFDRDHAAKWGQPYLVAKTTVQEYVETYRPDFVLVLLGINDLVWYDTDPDQFEANLREFIANARAGHHAVRLVLGTILETARATEDFVFAKRVSKCNDRIRAVAAELRLPLSPIEVADTAVEFVAAEHTWDDTHPNPNGEVRIAAAFADVLAQRFQIGATYPRPYPVLENIRPEAKAPRHVDTAEDAAA